MSTVTFITTAKCMRFVSLLAVRLILLTTDVTLSNHDCSETKQVVESCRVITKYYQNAVPIVEA